MNSTIYSFVLLAHITAASVLIGTSLMAPLIRGSIQSAGTARELLQWVTFARRATKLNPLTALVLLATGIYLGSAGWWATGWFAVSVVAWVLNGTLAGAVVKPMFQALAGAASAGDGDVSAELDQLRHAPRLQVAEEVMLGSDLAILLVMVMKPSLTVAAAVLGGASAAAVGVGALARLRKEVERSGSAAAVGRS